MTEEGSMQNGSADKCGQAAAFRKSREKPVAGLEPVSGGSVRRRRSAAACDVPDQVLGTDRKG